MRAVRPVSLLLAWLVTMIVVPGAAAATLTGRVLDARGRALAGAQVTAWSAAAKTDAAAQPLGSTVTSADGSFALEISGDVPAKFARVTAPGHAPAVVTVDARPLVVRLAEGHSFEGIVRTAYHGEPLADVTVTAQPRSDDTPELAAAPRPVAVTDGRGRFRLADLAPDFYHVVAGRDDWIPGTVDVRLGLDGPGPPTVVEIFLDGWRCILIGKVTGPTGEPVSGARLAVGVPRDDGDVMPIGSGAARPDGSFRLDLHVYDLYAVTAWAPGFAPVTVTTTPVRGPHSLDIALGAPARLALRLLHPGRTAYEGPVAVTWGAEIDREPLVVSARTDAEGRASVALPPGTWTVSIEVPGHVRIERSGLRLGAGEVTDVGDLDLDPGASIEGRALSADGTPVPGVVIKASCWPRRDEVSVTDAAGRFVLGGLDPRDRSGAGCRVLATAEGWERSGATVWPPVRGIELKLVRPGSIHGRVVTGDPPRPLRGALVDLDRWLPKIEIRDPEGRFTLAGLSPGRYTVRVAVPGYITARVGPVEVEPGKALDVGAVALVHGVTIRGTVLDAQEGTPLRHAAVWRVPAGVDAPPDAESDEFGRFAVHGLPPGRHVLQVDAGSWFARTEVDVDTLPGAEVVVRLGRAGWITGTVLDAAGQPCDRCDVYVPPGRIGTETDAEGKYTLWGLHAGRHLVVAFPRNSYGVAFDLLDGLQAQSVDMAAGETVQLDFPRGGGRIAVSGTLRREGEPFRGSIAWIAAGSSERAAVLFTSRVDGEGAFTAALPRAGTYRLLIGTLEEPEYSMLVEVPDRPVVQLDLALPTLRITGRVTGANGLPAADAAVTAYLADPRFEGLDLPDAATRTGPDGRYVLGGLAPGEYLVSVRGDGAPARRTVRLKQDDARLDVGLLAAASLRVAVVDEAGAPISHADISETELGASNTVPLTDSSGIVELGDLARGPVRLIVTAEGYAPAILEDLTCCEPKESAPHRVELARGGALVVRVEADDRPVPEILVRIRPKGRDEITGALQRRNDAELVTGADGTTTIPRLAAGEYEVWAEHGDRKARRTVTVKDPGRVEVTLNLR